MRQPIVAGNWKMNGSKASVAGLLDGILANANVDSEAEVVVIPPTVFLADVVQILSGSAIAWGAQTLSEHQAGAYTGEISASMLNDYQVKYVLAGHSERRQLFAESNEQVAAKFAMAQRAGLTPILCVGETQAQREAEQTWEIIKAQLDAVLVLSGAIQNFAQAVVAYEPVWAIGTGLTATPEQAQAVHEQIRGYLAAQDQVIAEQLRILYGGSVKAENAKALFAMQDIDGGLVGGASLDATSFNAIINAANER